MKLRYLNETQILVLEAENSVESAELWKLASKMPSSRLYPVEGERPFELRVQTYIPGETIEVMRQERDKAREALRIARATLSAHHGSGMPGISKCTICKEDDWNLYAEALGEVQSGFEKWWESLPKTDLGSSRRIGGGYINREIAKFIYDSIQASEKKT